MLTKESLFSLSVDVVYENENLREMDEYSSKIYETIADIGNKMAFTYDINILPPTIFEYRLADYKGRMLTIKENDGYTSDAEVIQECLIPPMSHALKEKVIKVVVFIFDINTQGISVVSKDFDAPFGFNKVEFNASNTMDFVVVSLHPYIFTPKSILYKKNYSMI